jgi:hypothetical protein
MDAGIALGSLAANVCLPGLVYDVNPHSTANT